MRKADAREYAPDGPALWIALSTVSTAGDTRPATASGAALSCWNSAILNCSIF
ncbi:hypothetical protein NSE_0775 [Neorickettsia sennetsu str. Miyayama]|uniref:Uncharacterized protein n=1 Tax=Ehrlichia sennetsu (strain ATCC VR-367 / Miyayama) TaxID=222891 RepID=Q2GCZ6_EHRS3|nr:hypothetical protein NSE_0775 [Neorickettsia sennetsu str. Miyayama]